MSDWVKVAPLENCPPGCMIGAHAGGQSLVVCNVEGDLYALEDLCSHQDLPISDGELHGTELTCIHHGARFDVCTGKALCLPAIRPVKTFEAEVREGHIWVNLA